MREREALYFTQAELEIMLELSGGCSFYRTGPPPDNGALTQAFASLYRRGFLVQKDNALLPDSRGTFFRELCAAPLAVVLTARYPRGSVAVCYVGGETIWLAEFTRTALAEEVRLWRTARRKFKTWLFDAGILEPPLLRREDILEWSALLEEEALPGPVRLSLETFENGGKPLGVYEIRDAPGMPLVFIREGDREEREIYTAEALEDLLDRALRKGQL